MFSIIKKLFKINYKMVLIVRTDLKMSSGQTAIQCSHAAVELYKQSLVNRWNKNLNIWSFLGQPKVVLKINSEKSLLDMYKNARERNMNVSLIYEIENGVKKTPTVLGLGPHLSDELDSLTKHLKLL